MSWKITTAVLALVVICESGYIFWARHRPINRFKSVDEDSYLAFDSATGQICGTARPRPAPRKVDESHSRSASPVHSDEPNQRDQILEAIKGPNPEVQAQEAAKIEFIRGLPACADIY
jgi:hypothetical protein